MELEKLMADGNQYLMYTYKRIPRSFVSGKGTKVYDTEGKEYTDFLAGVAVNSLGHCAEPVVKAIQEQAAKLMHISNYFWIDSQVALAKLLVENSFGDKVFFCNTGLEANEAAIKLARKYSYKKYGTHKNEIIAMRGSFHGRSLLTVSVTDNDKYQEGYGPLPGGVQFAQFNDIEALKKTISPKTCAVLLEPIQGEGGVTPAEVAYFQAVKQLCEENQALLIVDEIQCGIARTGKLFAYEHYGIKPDIMTLAKALAGGFPIGAIVATDEVAAAWQPGDHGTTFGGNPLACAAGVASLTAVLEQKLWETAAETGAYFAEQLQTLVDKVEVAEAVKGKGLLLGLLLKQEGAPVVAKALDAGFIINCTAGNVLRFVPPLIITKEEIDQLVQVLEKILKEME